MFYRARAASPTFSRLLATIVTDPSFESTAASALVAELVDFAAACRVDYATALVPESKSASPPFVGGLHLRLWGLLLVLLTRRCFYALTRRCRRSTSSCELCSYLGLQITPDRARRTITLTQSHMVHQVLQLFSFQFSFPQPTPLSTSHSLSAPPSNESVEPSGSYPELVGCLMVLRYLCNTSGMGLVLGGRGPVVLTGHANASWVDDSATLRSSQGYTFSLEREGEGERVGEGERDRERVRERGRGCEREGEGERERVRERGRGRDREKG
ncbi:unnamed protein product [Closterium sp. NIES-54]